MSAIFSELALIWCSLEAAHQSVLGKTLTFPSLFTKLSYAIDYGTAMALSMLLIKVVSK
jgi:hypothetical protein